VADDDSATEVREASSPAFDSAKSELINAPSDDDEEDEAEPASPRVA
ncbi:MAG: hypothetical protein HUK22_01195, partial [Thermoguttaceae bacterium]|nr:hypothetical protein [Thermoguttaceae bacterium]